MLNDIKRMRVDELRSLVSDDRRAVVHLQVYRTEVMMSVVLVPADQQASIRFNPVDPVVLIRIARSQLKPDFDASSRYWIVVIAEKLARIHVANDTIRASFARLSAPSSNVVTVSTEPLLDTVVEPFALQVRPVSEKYNH
nr:hypothetical protein [Halosolutus amylolyticus]